MAVAAPVEEGEEPDGEDEGLKPTLALLAEVPFVVPLLAPLDVSPDVLTQYTRLLLGFAGFSARMPLKDVRRSRARPALRLAAWRWARVTAPTIESELRPMTPVHG